MKSLLLKTLQGIAAGAVLLASPLCAELGHQFQLQIPFDFTAGNREFPAGAYSVKSDISSGVVLIHSEENGPAAFMMTRPAGENKDNGRVKLVFHRYGSQVFLSQVWPAGSSVRELIQSRKEAEVAKAARQPAVLSVVASAPGKPQR